MNNMSKAWNAECPKCGCHTAYHGYNLIECSNDRCADFSEKQKRLVEEELDRLDRLKQEERKAAASEKDITKAISRAYEQDDDKEEKLEADDEDDDSDKDPAPAAWWGGIGGLGYPYTPTHATDDVDEDQDKAMPDPDNIDSSNAYIPPDMGLD